MSQIDVIDAKKALATRLTMWGISPTEAGKHAAGFIDDLVARGWQMAPHRETRPHPPKPHEECGKHPGQYRHSCGGCATDRRAVRDEADARHREAATLRKAEAIAAARQALRDARETEEDQ